jgi:hypothetical protein
MGKKKMVASFDATASAAGSRVPTTSRKAGAAAKNLQCDWTASSITKWDEKKLRTLGLSLPTSQMLSSQVPILSQNLPLVSLSCSRRFCIVGYPSLPGTKEQLSMI